MATVYRPRVNEVAVMEPIELQRGLEAGSAIITANNFRVPICNVSQKDLWLKSGRRIGILRPGEILSTATLEIHVTNNEIIVGDETLSESDSGTAIETSSGNIEDAMASLLENFPGTSKERDYFAEIMRRNADAVAWNDDDLGCTNAVQHRIKLSEGDPTSDRNTVKSMFSDSRHFLWG